MQKGWKNDWLKEQKEDLKQILSRRKIDAKKLNQMREREEW